MGDSINILYKFPFVFLILQAAIFTIMDIHNGGPAAEGRRPSVVEAAEGRPIMVNMVA